MAKSNEHDPATSQLDLTRQLVGDQMATADERILAAITGAVDYEADPPRRDDDSDVDDDSEAHGAEGLGPLDGEAARVLEDQAIRQQLGATSGGAMTGPKGVLADYRFHARQERAREEEQRAFAAARVTRGALSGGWIARAVGQERDELTGVARGLEERRREAEDEADELIRALEEEEEDNIPVGGLSASGMAAASVSGLEGYRARRLLELAGLANRPRFGKCEELTSDEALLRAIDDEDTSVVVAVHLYDPRVEACRQVNVFLAGLAPLYPSVRFLRIVAKVADSDFDPLALPAILVYQGGKLLCPLLRIVDEIDGWARTGRCSLEDFEFFLRRNGVLEN
ncbi:hypothetical protein HK405_006450 [Cladochytrium tenue]|nr:hypothetical protein HK405_006450 [Cladochytrium tenue]